MKKKLVIPILLVVIVIGIIIAFLMLTRVIGKKPFADLRAEDIKFETNK